MRPSVLISNGPLRTTFWWVGPALRLPSLTWIRTSMVTHNPPRGHYGPFARGKEENRFFSLIPKAKRKMARRNAYFCRAHSLGLGRDANGRSGASGCHNHTLTRLEPSPLSSRCKGERRVGVENGLCSSRAGLSKPPLHFISFHFPNRSPKSV